MKTKEIITTVIDAESIIYPCYLKSKDETQHIKLLHRGHGVRVHFSNTCHEIYENKYSTISCGGYDDLIKGDLIESTEEEYMFNFTLAVGYFANQINSND